MHAELLIQRDDAPHGRSRAVVMRLEQALEQALAQRVGGVLVALQNLLLDIRLEHRGKLVVIADEDDPPGGQRHRDHEVEGVGPRCLVNDDGVEDHVVFRPHSFSLRHLAGVGLLAGGRVRGGVGPQRPLHRVGISLAATRGSLPGQDVPPRPAAAAATLPSPSRSHRGGP